MTTTTEHSTTTQVYRVYIKATPQAIWDAITKPEWTQRYGYTGLVDYDLRPGGTYRVRPTEQFRAGDAVEILVGDVHWSGRAILRRSSPASARRTIDVRDGIRPASQG